MSRIATIQSEICARYGVTLRDINGQSREKHIAQPRQVAMAIARDLYPDLTYSRIGAQFGGRDHSTAMHAHKAVEKRQVSDPDFHDEFTELSGRVFEMLNPSPFVFTTSRNGATQ